MKEASHNGQMLLYDSTYIRYWGQIQGRTVVARDLDGGVEETGSYCLMARKFQLSKMKKFWRRWW